MGLIRYWWVEKARGSQTFTSPLSGTGEAFAKRNWAQVITGENQISLNDCTILDEDDLYQIDNEGWGILGKYGLIPTVFVEGKINYGSDLH